MYTIEMAIASCIYLKFLACGASILCGRHSSAEGTPARGAPLAGEAVREQVRERLSDFGDRYAIANKCLPLRGKLGVCKLVFVKINFAISQRWEFR